MLKRGLLFPDLFVLISYLLCSHDYFMLKLIVEATYKLDAPLIQGIGQACSNQYNERIGPPLAERMGFYG